MRNRILEIVSALIGVAIVAVLYIDRDWFGTETSEQASPASTVEPVVDLQPARSLNAPPVTEEVREVFVSPVASDDQEPELGVVVPSLEDAEAAWTAARAELEVVEAELGQLDLRFDEAEAEFADMEEQAEDPEKLGDEMLIRLDAIVEQYEALEFRQVEAERAERIAAEALARAREVQP